MKTYSFYENFGFKYGNPSKAKLIFVCQVINIVEADILCKKAGFNPLNYACTIF